MDEFESRALWRRAAAGDAAAEAELYGRYAARLAAVARRNLAPPLRRRVDADDILQSAYRSFFLRMRQGKLLPPQRSGDLWQLLVKMVLHKLLHQVRRQHAGRRDQRRELTDPNFETLLFSDNDPQAATIAAEELARVMAPLSAEQRRTLELRLQDRTLQEIADAIGRSERTIRRWLDDIRRQWPNHEVETGAE